MSMPQSFSFGLLGYPLGHSRSPLIHAAALEALGLEGRYQLFQTKDEKEIPGLVEQLRTGLLHGLNVTVPYKTSIIGLMDVVSDSARSIGAVNTISNRDMEIVGENTDAGGFLADLDRLAWFPEIDRPRHALILGAGGAGRAVAYALMEKGWRVTVAARRLEQAHTLVNSFTEGEAIKHEVSRLDCIHLSQQELAAMPNSPDLIVNTTPLGMHPHQDASPWPENLVLPARSAVYDVVYNPVDTRFTRLAKSAGLRAESGLGMLVEQAALSFEIWTGLTAPRAEMHAALFSNNPGVI
jgi:shikimate dehydrogenase